MIFIARPPPISIENLPMRATDNFDYYDNDNDNV